MTPSLILYLLVVGGLVALSASTIDAAARRASLPTRWIWVAALGALVAFAVAVPRRDVVSTSLPLDAQVQYITESAATSPTRNFMS